ncbi:MAG: hypothetical protein ABIJ31_15980 [Pseudomonadota bacterium]
MKQNKIVIVVCLIALADIFYFGYQFFGKRNSDAITENPLSWKLNSSGLPSAQIENQTGPGLSKPIILENLDAKPAPGQVRSKNAGKTQPAPFLNTNVEKGEDQAGRTVSIDHKSKTLDPSRINALVQAMMQNNTQAMQQAIDIVNRTDDNAVLHKLLQGLGRMGSNEANQVLVDAIGNSLDNRIEVIRILSYLGRAVPLESGVIDRLVGYIDSPLATMETKQAIAKKIMQSGGIYGRKRADEFRGKLNLL